MPRRPSEIQWNNLVMSLFGIKSPMSVTFQISEDCNLNCTYCYQHDKSCKRMSIDVAKKAIDHILSDKWDYINTSSAGGIIIEFVGGEPLLETHLIDQIMKYMISEMVRLKHPWSGMRMISLCSNGLLYFDPDAQRFMKHYANGLSFTISIDGNKRLHDSCRIQPNGEGSYDVDIVALKHFRKTYMQGKMGSKMTLSPENISNLFEATVAMVENKYDIIYLNTVFEEVWEPKHATIQYDELKKVTDYLSENRLFNDIYLSMFIESGFCRQGYGQDGNWCGGSGCMLAIDPVGNYAPCLRFTKSSLGESVSMKIGDIHRGFEISVEEKANVQVLRNITRRSQQSDICFSCPIGSQCAWCTGHNFERFGTPNKSATFMCIMHISRALANVYYWNKFFIETDEPGVFLNNVPDEWSLKVIDQQELDKLNNLVNDARRDYKNRTGLNVEYGVSYNDHRQLSQTYMCYY